MVNYDKENCEPFQRYFAYYTVEQMAMLWCGIEPHDFSEVIGECTYPRRAIPQHPYISCLEFRAAAIMDSIEAKELAVGRDGRCHAISDDHVAPERRTVLLKDFKEWLIKTFPNEKPKLIFDDIERNTHSSITVEVYQTLLADRDHLQVRINKAEEVFREQKRRIESLEGENASLKNMVEKGVGGMDGRSERSYLNVIGGLISIMLSKSPGGQRYSIFDNQSAIIQTLLGHYVGKYGISDTNLEKKFAEANRSIRE
ncbi:protein kinase [Enterobacter kobei]|uniref:protein kinase n=1 Tax=Enterobacteriaceae TaxID=543 RepID=UPI0015A4AC3D|nr:MULTISPECIES: protein kinase [Enterobacteriaceae]MDC7949585.1 protein kinase [Enterobacter kobei]NWC62783.1 protein kinase [Cedecea sp. P7760]HCB1908673.1 protein kinase [Citrobacter braakii]HDT2141549.1 protein kinase [Enterobacter roggenkampii]